MPPKVNKSKDNAAGNDDDWMDPKHQMNNFLGNLEATLHKKTIEFDIKSKITALDLLEFYGLMLFPAIQMIFPDFKTRKIRDFLGKKAEKRWKLLKEQTVYELLIRTKNLNNLSSPFEIDIPKIETTPENKSRRPRTRRANNQQVYPVEVVDPVEAHVDDEEPEDAPVGLLEENNQMQEEEDDAEICSICHTDLYAEETLQCPQCKKDIHAQCIRDWWKRIQNCPMCRTRFLDPVDYPPLG